MYCWFFVHAGITCIFTKDFPEMLIAPFQIFTKISFGHHFVSISYFDLTIVMHAYYILASWDLWDSFFVCFCLSNCECNVVWIYLQQYLLIHESIYCWPSNFDLTIIYMYVYGSLFILLTFCDYKLSLIHYMIKLFIHYGIHLLHNFMCFFS